MFNFIQHKKRNQIVIATVVFAGMIWTPSTNAAALHDGYTTNAQGCLEREHQVPIHNPDGTIDAEAGTVTMHTVICEKTKPSLPPTDDPGYPANSFTPLSPDAWAYGAAKLDNCWAIAHADSETYSPGWGYVTFRANSGHNVSEDWDCGGAYGCTIHTIKSDIVEIWNRATGYIGIPVSVRMTGAGCGP